MKFTIQQLQQQTIQTKYGPKVKFRFTSNGQQFDAWLKKGYTDQFQDGYSFEAELSGKPYKGIDTISWPKQETSNVAQSSGQIEAKLDQIIRMLQGATITLSKSEVSTKDFVPSEIPYANSPAPDDKDFPGF